MVVGKYPSIDDVDRSALSAIEGVEMRRKHRLTEATIDVLIRYARAIGSRNPLFVDECHGTRTFWGTLIGHPTVLYTFDDTVIAPKLPGLHALYGGVDWEFMHPVRLGDRITATARYTGSKEHRSDFAGRTIEQLSEVTYTNQHGQTIAVAKASVLRFGRDEARARGKYADLQRPNYTEDQMGEILRTYATEQIRGDTPRYWDDVTEGDELPRIVKGPLTSEDINHFMGAVAGTRFFHQFLAHWRRHPADVSYDPETNAPDGWDASLIKESVAREFGFPYAHDSGIQRVAWLDALLTNWAGDLGFLQRLKVRLLRPTLLGDTTWCSGRITRKWEQGSQRLVEVTCWCEDQRGERTAEGSAQIALASRALDSRPPVLIEGPVVTNW